MIQDQIVACLYEIVETHRTEIRSGWRPLFGAIQNALHHHVNIVNITDIYRVLLDSDNSLVFANAGLDCILCLLFYLQVSSSAGITPTEVEMELLDEKLKFVERSASILSFMLNMPNGQNFHANYETTLPYYHYAKSIDANIPNSMENFTYFGNDYLQNINEQHMISYRSLHIDWESIDELDKSCVVLKVWFLLLNHLTTSLIVDPTAHQEPILQCILKLFKNLLTNPGIDFGFYCINQLLIPMIQNWLRYVNKSPNNWGAVEKNFKHCCGMTTDLVVEYIEKSQKRPSTSISANDTTLNTGKNQQYSGENLKFAQIQNKNVKWDTSSSEDSTILPIISMETPTKISGAATLSIKQLLLVLIECSAQTQETVARVGVSCLKHVILSSGHLFNEAQWMIACSAIHRACTVTVAPLRQLSFAFHEKSNSLNGDCASVKIESCRDSSVEDLNRINALAQQVFLMDIQRDPPGRKTSNTTSDPKIIADDRSYFFQLHHGNDNIIQISYRSVVIGMLANKMLLQLVAKLLLTNLKCVPSELHSCIAENYTTDFRGDIEIGSRSKEILLRCVKQCLTSALEFDARPGLKFLIQKISSIDFAANLYKQMTSAWMIYYVAMVDSYLSDSMNYNLGPEDLRYVLESCSRLNTSAVKKKDKKRENFVRYLFSLQDAWNLICEIYINNSNNQSSCTSLDKSATIELKTDIGSNGCFEDLIETEREINDNIVTAPLSATTASISKTPTRDAPISTFPPPRRNPFDVTQFHKTVDVTEIDQQRASSILKDAGFKRSALAQLVIASMELLRSLPNDSAENLKVLMTPTIREAFRLVKIQLNENLY